jgi:phenylalanyl-tRNA synthetase alpha subunit
MSESITSNGTSGKGHLHPLSQMIAEINSIFGEIGFVFAEGPEADSSTTTSIDSMFQKTTPLVTCRIHSGLSL